MGRKTLPRGRCRVCGTWVGEVVTIDGVLWWHPRALPTSGGADWNATAPMTRKDGREMLGDAVGEDFASSEVYGHRNEAVSYVHLHDGLAPHTERLPRSGTVIGWCADHERQEVKVADLLREVRRTARKGA